MTTVLAAIGYWAGPEAPDGLPDVCAFVSAADSAVQDAVAGYLRSGTPFAFSGGVSVCRLCGAANGSAEQTDGAHFVWPEGLAHYVEEHGVRLPDEVVAVASRGPAPDGDLEWFTHALLETGEVTVDMEWWRRAGQSSAGQTVEHLPGCRHSATVAGAGLPTGADIYVDRVPQDAITTLAGIRRLLGATWPYAELRGLLASQPFHAATDDPTRLYRLLRVHPDLRPYLFYDTGGRLMPVWSAHTIRE